MYIYIYVCVCVCVYVLSIALYLSLSLSREYSRGEVVARALLLHGVVRLREPLRRRANLQQRESSLSTTYWSESSLSFR